MNEDELVEIVQASELDADIQGLSLFTLSQRKDERSVEIAIKLMESDNDVIASWAAWTLIHFSNSTAIEPLVKALKYKNSKVKNNAAFALANMKAVEAVQPLLDLLQNDTDPDVRGTAANCLARIGSNQSYEALVKALEDRNNYVQTKAATALGILGNPEAIDVLVLKAFNPLHPDDLRCAAIEALGKLKAKDAFPLILSILENEKGLMEIRIAAAKAFSYVAFKAALPTFNHLFDDALLKYRAGVDNSDNNAKFISALNHARGKAEEENE